MSLPKRQDEESPGWTKRQLFALSAAVSAVFKALNVFEAVLLLQMIVTGVGELANRHLSFEWYFTLVLILGFNAYLRIAKKE